jgi:hypothetical protein
VESFDKLVKAVDGFISATCPGGKRFQGANATFATLVLLGLIWVGFFKDNSLYSQFTGLVTDVRDLAENVRADRTELVGLSNQLAHTNGRVTIVEDKVSDLNVKVQVLDNVAVKKR